VAVVSFDSHLKLRQDFTADKDKLVIAIHDAIRTGNDSPQPIESVPSLARHFDYAAARRTVTHEGALGVVARAAAPIVGANTMIHFAYGLGTIGGLKGPNPKDRYDLIRAAPAIGEARISIFTIDTPIGGHSLSKTLYSLAWATGGSYQEAPYPPDQVLGRVLEATSRRYEIGFKRPDLPRGVHTMEVKLPHRTGPRLAKAR